MENHYALKKLIDETRDPRLKKSLEGVDGLLRSLSGPEYMRKIQETAGEFSCYELSKRPRKLN